MQLRSSPGAGSRALDQLHDPVDDLLPATGRWCRSRPRRRPRAAAPPSASSRAGRAARSRAAPRPPAPRRRAAPARRRGGGRARPDRRSGRPSPAHRARRRCRCRVPPPRSRRPRSARAASRAARRAPARARRPCELAPVTRGVADRVADVRAVEQHLGVVVVAARAARSRAARASRPSAAPSSRSAALAQRPERDRPVHRARVEVGEAEPARDPARNRALPAARGPVDRDDHRPEA